MKALTILPAVVTAFFVAGSAHALTADFSPSADGSASEYSTGTLDTTGNTISVTQSGGLYVNGVFEFDLSSLSDAATINSATLTLTITRFVSNLGSTAAIDVFAFLGDGVVQMSDATATGTQVVDTTIPTGGSGGDDFSFAFTSVSPVSDALAGNKLTVRVETDSFASILFASLENADYAAATLSIDYTMPAGSQVPLPAGLPLVLTGLGALGVTGMRRRRG